MSRGGGLQGQKWPPGPGGTIRGERSTAANRVLADVQAAGRPRPRASGSVCSEDEPVSPCSFSRTEAVGAPPGVTSQVPFLQGGSLSALPVGAPDGPGDGVLVALRVPRAP